MDKIDYTPIEKYNKKLKEATKELNRETKNLRKPFQKLAEDLGKINKDFAKIAVDAVKKDSDTFQGLITKRRVQAEINARKEDKEYQENAKRLLEFQKREAKLAEEQYQRELKFQTDRQKIFEEDRIGFGSLRDLNQKKLEEETKLQNASVKERGKIQEKLSELDKKIVDRQELVGLNLERRYQSETKANEKQIELEKKNIAKTEEFVNTYNDEFDKKIQELQETPNYDKFTGAIKQLTGGIVDIDSFLNPIAKTFKSLGDLKDVTKDAVSGISNFMTKNKESSLVSEKLEEARQKKEDKRDKKRERSSNRFALGLNGFTLLLAAAAATLAVFIMKADKFTTALGNMLGITPEPKGSVDTNTAIETNELVKDINTPNYDEGSETVTNDLTETQELPELPPVNKSPEEMSPPPVRIISDEEKKRLEDGVAQLDSDIEEIKLEETLDSSVSSGTAAAGTSVVNRLGRTGIEVVEEIQTNPSTLGGIKEASKNIVKNSVRKVPLVGTAAGVILTAQDVKQAMENAEEAESAVKQLYENGAFNFEKGENKTFPEYSGEELYAVMMDAIQNQKTQDTVVNPLAIGLGIVAGIGTAIATGGTAIPALAAAATTYIASETGDALMTGDDMLEYISDRALEAGDSDFVLQPSVEKLEEIRDEAQDLLDAQPETVIDKISAKNIEDLSKEERQNMDYSNTRAREEVMFHGGVVQQNNSSSNIAVIRSNVINKERHDAMTRYYMGGFRMGW